jgi:thiosulfate reductase cytochrome b subunit
MRGRYVGEVREASGFTNPAMMRDSYVMGATRYVPLDLFAYVVAGGSLLAVAAHAAMRVIRRLPTARGSQERTSRCRAATAGGALWLGGSARLPPMTSHVIWLSLWIRLWHWLTALSFILLTITGIILHFGSPAGAALSYDTATALHDVSGIFMSVLYGVHLVFMIGTGYWRRYIPSGEKFWARLRVQVIFYTVGLERKPYAGPTADSRFNVLQQLSYLIVVFALLPLLIVTGLLYLYYPALVPEIVLGLAGLWPLALAHYSLGILGAAYLVVHVYMATMR